MPLSALVIARNEEKNISECLNSLKFADEIVVILDRSTDKTEKISKNYTKKIFSGSWSQEGDRRNFGIKKCKHEWILEVDADEIIPIKLAAEIKASILQKEFDFFYIRLENFVNQKKIIGGWMACLAPDGKFCLFKKNCKRWFNKKVHPDYYLKGKKGKELKNVINHMMSKNISQLIERFNRNTSLNAEDLVEKNTNLTKSTSVRKIFSRFFKSYFSRRGFANGGVGILIAILCSIYPYVSALKAKFIKSS